MLEIAGTKGINDPFHFCNTMEWGGGLFGCQTVPRLGPGRE